MSSAASPSLRVVLADDEPPAREFLESLLATEPDVTLLRSCRHGEETVEAVRELRPDLLFLDVQMPRLDGFEVLEQLGEELPTGIIFVTAFDQHALRAFEYHALDYLLKPFGASRFQRALARAREILGTPARREEHAQSVQSLVGNSPHRSPYLQRFLLKSAGRIHFRRVTELDWAESEGNYVRLHFGNEAHLQREKLSALEAMLDPAHFARPHRSILVNIDRIKELRQVFHGDYLVILRNGVEVPLGKPYRERFLAQVTG